MSTCPGCGGVVGRDCFNPQECQEIGRAMDMEYQQAGQYIGHLEAENARLRKQVEQLVRMIDGSGGLVPGRTYAETQRRIAEITEILGGEEHAEPDEDT